MISSSTDFAIGGCTMRKQTQRYNHTRADANRSKPRGAVDEALSCRASLIEQNEYTDLLNS